MTRIRSYGAFAHDLSLRVKIDGINMVIRDEQIQKKHTRRKDNKHARNRSTHTMKTQNEPGKVQKTTEGWIITGLGINLRHIRMDKGWPDMNFIKISENPVRWKTIIQYSDGVKWIEIFETNKCCPTTQQALQKMSDEQPNVMIQVHDTSEHSYGAFAHQLSTNVENYGQNMDR